MYQAHAKLKVFNREMENWKPGNFALLINHGAKLCEQVSTSCTRRLMMTGFWLV